MSQKNEITVFSYCRTRWRRETYWDTDNNTRKIFVYEDIKHFGTFLFFSLLAIGCHVDGLAVRMLTKSMEQSPSLLLNHTRNPQNLRTVMIHHHVHTSSLLAPIFKPHKSSPHLTSYSLRSILILSSHLRLHHSRDILPSGVPTKNPEAHFFSAMRATCPAHLILLDHSNNILLVIQIMKLPIMRG
jgi:hypothetical protein